MRDMSADTNLKLRGSVYHFRRRIPADLVEVFGAEVSYSLKTKDQRERSARRARNTLRWEQRFDDERSKRRAPAIGSETPPQELTEETAREVGEALAAEWIRDVLQEDEDSRVDGADSWVFDRQTADYADIESAFREALARGKPDLVNVTLQEALAMHRIRVKKESRAYRLVVREFLKAAVHLSEMLSARQRGEVVEHACEACNGPAPRRMQEQQYRPCRP